MRRLSAVVLAVLVLGLAGCRHRRHDDAPPPGPAPAPTLTAIAPTVGSTSGGTTITLTGTGFQPGVTVTVGGVVVTITSSTATQIVGTTGPGAAGAGTVVVTNPDGQAVTVPGAFTYDQPPLVAFSVASGRTCFAGDILAVTVTVTDPEGTAVSLTLLNPPPGAVSAPLRAVASPAAASLRWLVQPHSGGPQRLLWRAVDGAGTVTVATWTTHVLGALLPTGIVAADVTGDGILDTIALASLADTATLADVGAIHVWAGGASPSATPTATLTVPGAVALDRLGDTNGGQGVVTADVTGDGVLDIVAGATDANPGSVGNAGAIYVWAGGTTLAGAVSPTATLSVASPTVNDGLGNAATGTQGQGILCQDVTGDGTDDVIALAPLADVGTTVDAGAIYVWAGGTALTGAVGPTATLAVAGAVAVDKLGDLNGSGQGVQCADVTGDGTLDLVAGAPLANIGGVADTGAIYLWAGGTGLTGTPAPTATCTVAGAAAGDRLGDTAGGQGIVCADVTGDGVADIVAGAAGADASVIPDAGAVYVWRGGGTLTGSAQPYATGTVASPTNGDQLTAAGSGRGLQLADVTADGTLDIVATATFADPGGVVDAGVVHVFTGGTGLTGAVGPSATLAVTGATAADRLGNTNYGQGVVLTDVSGDGVADVVAGAFEADRGVTVDPGAIYVWLGSATLTGTVAPNATLAVTGGLANDQVGDAGGGQGIVIGDVTGDGTADIVAGACTANGAATDTGAVYVWAGGALAGTTAPVATLALTGGSASDQLGNAAGGAAGQGIWLADLTGDGLADVVVSSAFVDVGGTANAGAAYVWAGGSGLTGTPAPTATCTVTGAAANDELGDANVGLGTVISDLTGDGTLDLVLGAYQADVASVTDAGAAWLWAGGSGLTGTPTPVALTVTGATASDQVTACAGIGQGLVAADVTGDGTGDLLLGATLADPGATTNAGAVHLAPGGATPAVTRTFAVPGARAEDRLGR